MSEPSKEALEIAAQLADEQRLLDHMNVRSARIAQERAAAALQKLIDARDDSFVFLEKRLQQAELRAEAAERKLAEFRRAVHTYASLLPDGWSLHEIAKRYEDNP